MAKYQVLCDCYGFKNQYWEKGTIVDIDPKDNPPHHFKKISERESDKAIESKTPAEAITSTDVAREELLTEAKGRGIKDAEILNHDESLAVLSRDISPQKIRAIVQKAKKRLETA